MVRAAGLYPAGSRFESWLPYHSVVPAVDGCRVWTTLDCVGASAPRSRGFAPARSGARTPPCQRRPAATNASHLNGRAMISARLRPCGARHPRADVAFRSPQATPDPRHRRRCRAGRSRRRRRSDRARRGRRPHGRSGRDHGSAGDVQPAAHRRPTPSPTLEPTASPTPEPSRTPIPQLVPLATPTPKRGPRDEPLPQGRLREPGDEGAVHACGDADHAEHHPLEGRPVRRVPEAARHSRPAAVADEVRRQRAARLGGG